MSGYRIYLTLLVGLFVIVAIFSSIIGVGLLQGLLILVAFVLLLGIFIGGIAILGPGVFWQEYFKPMAALPIAWGLLHLGFVLLFPDASGELWAQHRKLLILIELGVFVLAVILPKKIPFEQRTSRKLLETTWILLLIVAGVAIGCRLFWGEFSANLNRMMLFKLANSKAELIAANIEKLTKDYQTKPFFKELTKLQEKAKKRLDEWERGAPILPERDILSELQKVENLKTDIQKRYAVPEKHQIRWEKWWPFRPKKEVCERPLCGVFKLPANGEIVDKDVNGRQLWYHQRERAQFCQLGQPGKFAVINRNIPSFEISSKTYLTGRATSDGKVELRSTEGKGIMVQVQIIPKKS